MDIEIKITLEEIMKHYCVSISDLKSLSRKSIINKARIHCFLILRDRFKISPRNIGVFFNRKESNIIQLTNKYRDEYKNSLLKLTFQDPLIDINEISNNQSLSRTVFYRKLLIKKDVLENEITLIKNLIKLYGKDDF